MKPESFQKSLWSVFPDGLRIHVCESWRWHEREDAELEQAVQAFKETRPPRNYARKWAEWAASLLGEPTHHEEAKSRVRAPTRTPDDHEDGEYYTFVAIEFNKMAVKLNDGKWVFTHWTHHVSLAYLPPLGSQRYKLQQDLNAVMQNYIAIREEPHLMPSRLLHFRCCKCYRDCDETDFIQPLIEFLPDELENELEMNSIELLTSPKGSETKRAMIKRLYERDIQRMSDAPIGKAVSVGPGGRQRPMTMQLSGGRVHADSEMATLLFYLRDRLIYRFGVFHMEGKVGLHHERSWHVTPVTEDLTAVANLPRRLHPTTQVVRVEELDCLTTHFLESCNPLNQLD